MQHNITFNVAHLHTLKHIQEVIHACQMLNILENCHQQGGRDGNGASKEHPSKARPAKVQEALCRHVKI